MVSRSQLDPIEFEGLEIFDYTAGAKLGSSFAVIDVPPDAEHRKAYSHRSDKYYFVVSGRLDFALGTRRLDLGPGDLCVVPKGDTFSYANRSGAPAQIVLVHTPSFDLESEEFVE